MIRVSKKLSATAETRIATSPVPGSGEGRSPTSSASGPSRDLHRTAFIAYLSPNASLYAKSKGHARILRNRSRTNIEAHEYGQTFAFSPRFRRQVLFYNRRSSPRFRGKVGYIQGRPPFAGLSLGERGRDNLAAQLQARRRGTDPRRDRFAKLPPSAARGVCA